MTISRALRQRIRRRADFLCEYCHASEEASTSLFSIPERENGQIILSTRRKWRYFNQGGDGNH